MCICGQRCLSEVFASLLNGHFNNTDTSWKRLLMGPCRFSVIWLEFSIWQALHQGGHSMVVSEVCTYGGHLSKRTVVPAVYILEKVTTWDWTTAGTNSKCPFWKEAFLIDTCKPEVKHFSLNMPWSYQIGILKCLFSHRNDLLKIWSKSRPKIAKRLLPGDVRPSRTSLRIVSCNINLSNDDF